MLSGLDDSGHIARLQRTSQIRQVPRATQLMASEFDARKPKPLGTLDIMSPENPFESNSKQIYTIIMKIMLPQKPSSECIM